MDYLSFFKKTLVPQEPIAGLEITDSFIRLVLLSLDKKTGLINTRECSKQPLAPDIIINGQVNDVNGLCSALFTFKRNLRIPIDYVIASIPSNGIYTKTLSFPKNIDEQKLNEAIKLAIDFQLPYKTDDVYFSWEITAGQNQQKVFVAEAPKKIIDPYIKCILKTFNLIALEFHAASFSRAAALEPDKTILLKIDHLGGTNIFIVKDKEIIFSRSLEYKTFPEKKIGKELKKIINFYESESNEKISATINLPQDSVPISGKINFPVENSNYWLIALGAAERGLIPRREDNFISFLPISPQKAYKYHKAISFTSIMTGLIIGLSVFFIIAFLGTWILIVSLQQQSLKKTDGFSSPPSMIDLTAVETRIENANSLISTTAGILAGSPNWSILINELQGLIIPGITVDSLSLGSPEATLNISGVATDRPTLNQFRDKLKSSAMITNINLPLTNLDQAADIPFNISFELKNSASLYSK